MRLLLVVGSLLILAVAPVAAETPAEVFADTEMVSDGLGPRFNLDSCGGCHAFPSLGGTSPPINPQVALATAFGARNELPSFITLLGPIREARFKDDGQVHQLFVIRDRSDIPGKVPECPVQQPNFDQQLKKQNVIFRIPTPVFGAGLVEAIPDATILAQRDQVAPVATPLGIHGTPSRVGGQAGRVGRFGWKAQHFDLAAFAAEAYNVEMGITNTMQPTELERHKQCQFAPVPNDVDNDVAEFVAFMRALPPPPPPLTSTGRMVFDTVGCGLCHTPVLGGVPAFSDFLVHDMGTLGDGIVQGSVGGAQFRTAPLWGVGQRLFLLHDGRTADLATAIQAHSSPGSEANTVVTRFQGRSASDREALLTFLKGL
jgi:CxxC motif-containing protein (DUF1111 family)